MNKFETLSSKDEQLANVAAFSFHPRSRFYHAAYVACYAKYYGAYENGDRRQE